MAKLSRGDENGDGIAYPVLRMGDRGVSAWSVGGRVSTRADPAEERDTVWPPVPASSASSS